MENWLEMCFRGGQIRRFHSWPTIGQETVAEHSYYVCMLVLALTDGKASSNLLKAALFHDLAEQATGDIPATTKWANPLLKANLDAIEEIFEAKWNIAIALPEDDKLVLKWSDMLALLFYCKQQRDLGNRGMNVVFTRGVDYLNNLKQLESGKKVLTYLIESYTA